MALSAAVGVVAALAPAPASAVSGSTAGGGTVSVPGATIVGEQWLTRRTLELTVATPSFTAPIKVEVMLPTGYASAPTRRWPVTYYLAGTHHDQTTFRTGYEGEALTASYPSIVVSPSGQAGYWSDWYNNGAGGPPMYETFVAKQLVPLVDVNLRTVADRAHRAVMGESMGGYGALMLAARHPDLFVAASSLSGATDTNWVPGAAAVSGSSAIDLALPDAIYGPRATNEVRWRGHNPTDLAENLRRIDLQLYTGNGIPGADESDPTGANGCALEAGGIRPETQSMHDRLVALGIPHRFTAYNWGCHSPVLFEQEITESLPRFTSLFAKVAPSPTTFDYRSIEPRFHVSGWSITADSRRAAEFLDLQRVGATGLTITGSGLTRVTTPPLFRGARAVTVIIDGVARRVQPDPAGHLAVLVDLGPADQDQQYTPGAVTDLRTRVVRFVRS